MFSCRVPAMAGIFLCFAFASNAHAGTIAWADAKKTGITPFWEEGVYAPISGDVVHFMGELPMKTKVWGAGWVKGDKTLLSPLENFRLGKEFKLTGWQNGPARVALLFVEGETAKHGKGWLLFAATVPGLNPFKSHEAWPQLQELWKAHQWAIGPVKSEKWTLRVGESETYEGESISVTIGSQGKGLSLDIQNKAGGVVQILWDQCSFVGTDGYADGVIHTGTRLVEKGAPQAPTTIPPGAKVEESVYPKKKISWVDGWVYESLFPEQDTGKFTLLLALSVDGKTVYESIEVSFLVERTEPAL